MATVTASEVLSPHHDLEIVLPRLQPERSTQTSSATPPARTEPLDVEATSETEPIYLTGRKLWFIRISLCVILILGGLDANIVATAVPSITDHFHTVADVGWYSSAFRLCTCAFQFVFAKLYKLFPIKAIFMASNVVFLIGSLLCATATSSKMFIVGRALTGVGFAGEMAGCFAVAVDYTPLETRPLFAGVMASFESLAIIAAPIVGGALTQSLGWRINLPIGGLSLATMFFLFPDLRTLQDDELTLAQKIKELDLVSNCLFIPALTALFIALSWAGTKYPWSDGKVIGLFVVVAALMVAFGFNQHRRGDSAALPFRIITNRNVIAASIFTACANSMTNVLEWYLPTYYQIVRSRVRSSWLTGMM
nr:efflux pump aflt [Quercus suber]